MPARTFSARIDLGIGLLLAALTVACFGLAALMFFAPQPIYLGGAIMLLLGAMLLGICLRTVYRITPQYVVVRCGPIPWWISLDRITCVEKTSDPMLLVGGTRIRLALSAQALLIHHGERRFWGIQPTVLISPKDRDTFLECLKEEAPGLEFNPQGNLIRDVGEVASEE